MALASGYVQFQEQDLSDEEVENSIEHQKLLQNVAAMCNKQRVNSHDTKRFDTNQQLLKTHSKDDDSNDEDSKLFKGVLKERVTLRELKLKVPVNNKQIKKSLEKMQEDKIKRVVGYKNVKKDLNKWSSIVKRNKLAPQLTFPILEKKVENQTSYDFLTTFKEPTELEKEMAKVLNVSVIAQEERKEENELSKLPIEEMIERRNMAAKMRARESYRISKAIRQNKIKSKKYHRILKKEKIKQELKNFEKLQKTDPEAAMEKLEQIERARAEERISLRHKNTGKWARSKAIRAKYDTEARIELAEQLAKSRELTRKVKAIENSSSEDENEEGTSEDENDKIVNTSKVNNAPIEYNPWALGFKQFIENNEKSKQEITEKSNTNHVDNNVANEEIISEKEKVNLSDSEEDEPQMELNSLNNGVEHQILSAELQENDDDSEEECSEVEAGGSQPKQIENNGSKSEVTDIQDKTQVGDIDEGTSSGEKDSSESNLPVPSNKQISLNEMFDEAEDIIQEHASEQLTKLKLGLLAEDDLKEKQTSEKKESRKYEFKQQTMLRDIDAALIEVADEGISSGQNDLQELKDKLNSNYENKKEKEAQIDPNKMINAKPQMLSAELPDFDESGDISEDEEEKKRHLNLIEAFAEDDIVDQFRNEKKEEAKASKGKVIDLSLPGWGSWGGTGLEKSKRKTRRFMVRIPKIPRKDQKKPNVIINEDPIPKLREQMVNELPYPFTSVKDFEASIRAPIGKHWVSEKGFKKLTAPPVLTKMGTIIEPLSSSMLAEKPIEKKRPFNNKQEVKTKKRKFHK